PPPEPATARPAPRALLGAGSCTSSGCHAAAYAGHADWRSAYTVWAARDPHAGAHEALRGPLADRIVAALAARDPARPRPPATENLACIGCHATGRGAAVGEGVSCESCHGPAGQWLAAHTTAGWTTRGNDLGMIDLADPFTCAETCADCHVGGPPTADGAIREVTHDLVAAGHPRLAFELRGYKRAEPPHWRDRFAAPANATAPGPLDEWAAGRLGTLAQFLRQIESQAEAARTGRQGLACGTWPEFTAFDCHGCHRPAAFAAPAPQSATRPDSPPGSPRLEPMYWTHLDVILPAAEAATLARVRAGIDRAWARVPPTQSLADVLHAVEAARPGLHERLVAAPAGELAGRIVAGTNAANWAEAVSALGALEAVADREAAAGRTAIAGDVRPQFAALRELLEFPVESAAGTTVRFSSPRGYDAAAVSERLRLIAESLMRVAERLEVP
ncbi:MAG: multiheme c-type cytochrome, partial [Planctomycetaceae bacterium]